MYADGNFYDDVRPDIEALHRSPMSLGEPTIRHSSLKLTKWAVKRGLMEKLFDIGFIRDLFEEFNTYWVQILHYRRLRLHDFFWLYAHYRTKVAHETIRQDTLASTQGYMKAWQTPERMASLFRYVYNCALAPLRYLPYREYILSAEHILEYGCGIAPITYGAIKYEKARRLRHHHFTIADIRGILFHYAKWRLSGLPNVRFVDLEPYDMKEFDNKFDLVFMTTVLEHLPNPLRVIEHIHGQMSTGGILIFDYIKAEGKGLDHPNSVQEREAVLNFIKGMYETLVGTIDLDSSLPATTVRKR